MSARLVALLSLTAAAAFVPADASHAAPTSGPGFAKCGLWAHPELAPDAPDGAVTGALFAGPGVATVPGSLASGTFTCSVQVDDPVHGTTSNDRARESVATVSGLVLLEPRTVNVIAPVTSTMYVCSQFTFSTGERYYWDGPGATWVLGDDTVACDAVTEIGGDAQAMDDVRTATCPSIATLPFGLDVVVGDLWGCNGPSVADVDVAYVAVPPTS